MSNSADDLEKLIAQLEAEKAELLAAKPELVPLQKEIDRALNAAGSDPLKRAEKAYEMLSETIKNEFLPEMDKLERLVSSDIRHVKSKFKESIGKADNLIPISKGKKS